jgi:hypothetical protein
MIRNLIRTIALVVPLAALLPVTAGCMAADEMPPPAYADGTEPLYYDGYVVYYDDGGRPFYYRGGERVVIEASDPLYGRFVEHWNRYGGAHRAWAAERGARYRGYRASPRGGRGGRR